MNVWLLCALVLMVPLALCCAGCLWGESSRRLVALLMSGEVATLILLALALAYHRAFYVDCALAAAILPYPSSIVYAHFFEKWL